MSPGVILEAVGVIGKILNKSPRFRKGDEEAREIWLSADISAYRKKHRISFEEMSIRLGIDSREIERLQRGQRAMKRSTRRKLKKAAVRPFP